ELRQRINELRSNLREWRGDEEEQERQLRRMLSLALTGKVHRGSGGGGNGSRRSGGGFPYRVFVDGRESTRGPARGRSGDFRWQFRDCGGGGEDGRFTREEWFAFLESQG